MLESHLQNHIREVAQCPSFSTYEERLHPYIRSVFKALPEFEEMPVQGNNLIFRHSRGSDRPTIAITSHIDKINHYGEDYPDVLPVSVTSKQIEGAMDDSAGVGLCLALAEASVGKDWPGLMFFFSEMEEKKGLKEHPERLKNNGKGYMHGMGARRIAETCKTHNCVPDRVITLDTTPLFKGEPGIALYSNHWELTELFASKSLKDVTEKTVEALSHIYPDIKLHNNTNDYLHYGYEFNVDSAKEVVSIAVEPSIYPYHQQGEKVYKKDIQHVFYIVSTYLSGEEF
ncbi:MAG TPA: M28 family peptidase [Fodinibius sp.]|nr:M28 family peptidase [Fodinibius sp.]